MQKAIGTIKRLVAKRKATTEARRQLDKEDIPSLSVAWSCEPAWESWAAVRQIETVPFAGRPICDVAQGSVSTTSYPLA